MEPEHLKQILESLLFVSGKPVTAKELAKFLGQEEALVTEALNDLLENKKTAGVVLLESGGQYQLATNSANSTYVKNYLQAELREKLTDATVEVLAIIAYRQPISRAEIEAIRGVNSQYSVRNLLMRGLIEKIPNPADARSYLYQTTTEFFQHMGLTSTKDLPEFQKLVEQIKLPQVPQAQEPPAQPESGTKEAQAESSESRQEPQTQPGPVPDAFAREYSPGEKSVPAIEKETAIAPVPTQENQSLPAKIGYSGQGDAGDEEKAEAEEYEDEDEEDDDEEE